MSLIRQVSMVGIIFYGLIFVIQAMDHRPVWGESLAGIAIIAFLGAISFKSDEHPLHVGEMILIWACILLFALYALLRAGGII
ncbi:MAG: hypothetical protein CVV33_09865 [Methanomicrobiales archaeon HGW-Methanomicrobiales-4]|nr:MAG: hypothetical protein CVV33_09865 [Methanomicrobiales archaeon HGW-Methanomicrobiales-4]